MGDEGKTDTGRAPREPSREERLAEALRANLHRRKAQARARRAANDTAGNNEKEGE